MWRYFKVLCANIPYPKIIARLKAPWPVAAPLSRIVPHSTPVELPVEARRPERHAVPSVRTTPMVERVPPHRQPRTACRAGAARWRSFSRLARTASRLRRAGVAVTGPVRPRPMPAGRPIACAPATHVLGHLRAPALGGYMPGGRGIARIDIRREAEQGAASVDENVPIDDPRTHAGRPAGVIPSAGGRRRPPP